MTLPNNEDALEWFRQAARLPEEGIDLVEGALLIAQAEYLDLDRSAYRGRLEEMGREAREVCANPPWATTRERLEKLSRVFSERWRFHGNRDDYYDPRNSFLNDVLDRRTGIPITLSLVYIEIGRRAGVELVGIGMPGHFLAGCAGRSDLFVDAFSEGAILTGDDCAARLRELQPELVWRPEFLKPVGPRQILTRMLNNLLEIYLRTQGYLKALRSLEMILCLQPGEPEWLRRRALVHYQMRNYSRAIADLQSYLEHVPEASDRDEVTRQLTVLQHLRSRVN